VVLQVGEFSVVAGIQHAMTPSRLPFAIAIATVDVDVDGA
jgi:hypothetical protein